MSVNLSFDLPSSGHGCVPMCAACRADLKNRMNPTGDPLGFNVDRWLVGEQQAACGKHTPAQQVFARLREKYNGPDAYPVAEVP